MIHLNCFDRQWQEIGSAVHATVERIGAAGRYILGEAVCELERALAARWGLPWCIGVGNGHDALEIALRSLGLDPGDRVLTTPLSAFATTQAVLRAGGEPVFVDVDEFGLLDLECCRRALADDSGIRFLVPVHLYGRSLDLDRLEQLAREYGLVVVEDCAQSIGASWHGRHPGTVGNAATTSFYPTKNLAALGDGGAILTASEAVANRARALRHSGRSPSGSHDVVGCNSRLDELQAAILGEVMLPRLDGWLARRRSHAAYLLEHIHHPHIRLPATTDGHQPSWHLFPVQVTGGDRGSLRRHLEAYDIECGVHYPQLITAQPALAGRGDIRAVGGLEVARRLTREELSLPIHPFLTAGELEAVAIACNAWEA